MLSGSSEQGGFTVVLARPSVCVCVFCHCLRKQHAEPPQTMRRCAPLELGYRYRHQTCEGGTRCDGDRTTAVAALRHVSNQSIKFQAPKPTLSKPFCTVPRAACRVASIGGLLWHPPCCTPTHSDTGTQPCPQVAPGDGAAWWTGQVG